MITDRQTGKSRGYGFVSHFCYIYFILRYERYVGTWILNEITVSKPSKPHLSGLRFVLQSGIENPASIR